MRQAIHEWHILEAARPADAQRCEAAATEGGVWCEDPACDGLEREGVLRAAALAKRQLEASTCETRCGRNMQQVYWQRADLESVFIEFATCFASA